MDAETRPDNVAYLGWEQPVSLTQPDTPPWPDDLLPGVVGEFAQAVSESTETPPEIAMNDILGVLATAAQRKYEVHMRPGYCEPLSYWGLSIQPPATRKSSVKAQTTRPLVEWEAEQAMALKDDIRDARSKHKTELKIIEGLRNKAGRAKTAQERDDIIQDVVKLEASLTEVPTLPRLWTDDITPERLAALMAENHERMGIFSAEGGVFGIMAGRYSNGSPNLNIFLKGHAGDAERVDRGSRDPVYLNNPALSMGLAVQPEVLHGLTRQREFRGYGLTARFVFAMPNARLGKRKLETQPVSGALSLGYAGRVQAILNREWNTDGERLTPYEIKPSEDAYKVWRGFWYQVEDRLADGGELEHVRDWGGKLPGLVARVAGLVHIARHATVQPEQYPICQEDMFNAVRWGQAVKDHALAAFDFMGASTDMDDARHVLRWIRRNRLDDFRQRDCHNSMQSRFPKADDLEAALRILEDRHYIREKPREKKPGRPTRAFEVNPMCTK